MLKYLFSKMLIVCAFLFLIEFPFFCAAFIFKSKIFLIIGGVVGLLLFAFIILTAFHDYSESIKAFPADVGSALEKSVERIRRTHRLSKVQFWVFPDPEQRVEYWIGMGKRIDVLMSQGSLSRLSEADLTLICQTAIQFQKSSLERWSKSTQQDAQSIVRVFSKVKGDIRGFRFWFVSFWLIPFEKTLKFSSRLL